jgi:hypothetical protein
MKINRLNKSYHIYRNENTHVIVGENDADIGNSRICIHVKKKEKKFLFLFERKDFLSN